MRKIVRKARQLLPWLEPPYFIIPLNGPGTIRPYFGEIAGVGGPQVRTRRMVSVFGNHWLSPNLLYVNSAGGFSLRKLATSRRHNPGLRIVVNQNGLYYPAWYKGDWRAQNEYFREVHSLADHVIFQSEFCLSAYEALVGEAKKDRTILHNAPMIVSEDFDPQPEGGALLLAGVWGADAAHILKPALEAMKTLGREGFKLRLAGTFTPEARRSEWFASTWLEIEALRNADCLEYTGPYRAGELPRILKGVEIALHLKYKDPCPNAVVERMAYGIPHVYSDSGGTPELIGDSGIGLSVVESWNEMQAVPVPELISAVKEARGRWRELSTAAKERQRQKFSWEGYEFAHQQIFRKVLGEKPQ